MIVTYDEFMISIKQEEKTNSSIVGASVDNKTNK